MRRFICIYVVLLIGCVGEEGDGGSNLALEEVGKKQQALVPYYNWTVRNCSLVKNLFNYNGKVPFTNSYQCFVSKTNVINILAGRGFHKTASYAQQYGIDIDYTKTLTTVCGYGVIRTQALIEQLSGCWTYKYQDDLNPEINSYPNPDSYWASDVFWWHMYH